MSASRQAPGRWLYLVAAALPLLGIGWAARQVVSTVRSYTAAYRQVIVPGEATVHLDAPGRYAIFHEYESVAGGRVFSGAQKVPGLACSLTELASGREVELRAASSHTTYALGGREGVSLFELDAPAPGDYRLRAGYPAGQMGEETVLAIGLHDPFAIGTALFGSIAAVGLGARAGGALALWVFLRRRGALGPRPASLAPR